MVLKSGSEATLLQASKQYDAALKEQKLDKLDSLVDPNYTIHADGITLKVAKCLLVHAKVWLKGPLQQQSHGTAPAVLCCLPVMSYPCCTLTLHCVH